MRSLNEITLSARVSLFGDRKAFDSLVREHQESVRRLFLHLSLGDTMLSDDLAQDTFIKAWTNIGKFGGRSSFKTWLFAIAFRTWADYFRSRHEADDYEEAYQYGKEARDVGLRMDMLNAMKQLKPIERTCITLQVIEGMKTDAIAHITELNASTVRSHIARGKQKLAEYLKQNGYE